MTVLQTFIVLQTKTLMFHLHNLQPNVIQNLRLAEKTAIKFDIWMLGPHVDSGSVENAHF